jgi:hypothetical protein
MKRALFVTLAVLVLLTTAVVGAAASPGIDLDGEVGPYEGIFTGMVGGDEGSTAPMALRLIHRDRDVAGIVYLGQGMTIDAGRCGTYDLPATAEWVEGQTVAGDPYRLVANPSFEVEGFELTVDFESTVSADGQTVTAQARVDLPWLCGRDPIISGSLDRYGP